MLNFSPLDPLGLNPMEVKFERVPPNEDDTGVWIDLITYGYTSIYPFLMDKESLKKLGSFVDFWIEEEQGEKLSKLIKEGVTVKCYYRMVVGEEGTVIADFNIPTDYHLKDTMVITPLILDIADCIRENLAKSELPKGTSPDKTGIVRVCLNTKESIIYVELELNSFID